MKQTYHLQTHCNISLEEAWNALELAGIDILYGEEEEGDIHLYVQLSSIDEITSFEWIKSYVPYTLPVIDWQAQWAAHGQNFQEGYVHVDFSHFGHLASPLRLQAGEGFGDLSHPTTRLMLQGLAKHLKQQIVIDIGCGSGILTLAALRMGASYAYGIDIDPQAVEHSQKNAELNQLQKTCRFHLSSNFQWQQTSQHLLILMNMIQSEQQIAWSSFPNLQEQVAHVLTSGIPINQRTNYLALTQQWNWSLQEEYEEAGWLAFYFIQHR